MHVLRMLSQVALESAEVIAIRYTASRPDPLIHLGLVAPRTAPPLPPPLRLKGGPITTHEIEAAIDEGRE